MAVGVASVIGAIFRAPLGGAVLGAELLYRDDVEVEALIPSLVASVVAFATFGALEGYNPIFGFVDSYRFANAGHLVYFAAVGLAAGLVGRLYARSFYTFTAAFRRLRLPASIMPGVQSGPVAVRPGHPFVLSAPGAGSEPVVGPVTTP